MQNKGAIKLFAIAMALVCVYQLSFTFITRRIESKANAFAHSEAVYKQAKELAKGDLFKEKYYIDSISRYKERFYLDSMANVTVFNIWVQKLTYRECKEREINLGLDLKGGMNVTLEVSVVDIVRAMANENERNNPNSKFNKALNLAIKMQKSSQDDFVTLFGKAFNSVDPNAKLASIFNTVDLKGKISFNSTNDEVLTVIRTEATDAFDRTFNILRNRIDRFGVTQPNVQKLSTSDRILVELPGVKEPERVRKILQGTAKLEFWETYDYAEVYQYLDEANIKLRTIVNKVDTAAKKDTNTVKVADNQSAKKDSASTSADTSLSLIDQIAKADSSKTDSAKGATNFEEFAKENPLYAFLSPAVFQDEKGRYYPNKGPVVGYAAIKDTARINRLLAMAGNVIPRTIKFRWVFKPMDKGETMLQLIALKITTRDGSAPLDGGVITDARQDFDQQGGNEVTMQMNSEGAKIWKRLTAENIGKSIAIVLDDHVYSYPTVNGEIPNGRSSITGGFKLEEAKDLANVLKSGKLPAPARIVEEAVVGPSLGREAISSGLISFVLAFVLVLLYMAAYYNKAGLVANVALISNIFFIFGVLASLGAVLTLPGIAGIVLTLGMAVDANVIIYERIREELRAGKGIRLAISDGYKNAYSAIIDGNVTTIITGIVLFIFGSGPVQGFATTLIIGILTSLFTAIFISRMIFLWLMDKNKAISFDNKFSRNAFSKVNFDFIGKRKIMYTISGIVIALGIVSLAFKGLNLGVDFKGGRTYVVRFDQNVKSIDVRNALEKVYGEAPEVKMFGPSNQVKVTTKYLIDNTDVESDSIVEAKLFEGVKGFFVTPIKFEDFSTQNQEVGLLSSQKVGPTIADDIKVAAIWAVFFALIAIFIYIAIRFRKWQYGIGGVISLFHDTLIVISCYSIFYGLLPFTLEVDQAFIAAILTIIGYSINDTVIIFDRIREFNTLYPKRDMETNINKAINSTLGRTFNTAMTTLVVLIAIFIFGGEVIRGFVFALMVGIAIGTYSSIFNATPVAYEFIMMHKRRQERKQAKTAKK